MEPKEVNYDALLRLGRELLVALGEDPEREGLRETPRRFADAWREFVEYAPGKTETVFETTHADQLVVVSGMRVWSMCEHHLLPFWCDITIGYLTQGRVLGLSKFARLAHQAAHRLQLQERLVEEIAQEVCRLTGTEDVAVLAQGRHLCMEARGIRTPGLMTSSVMLGAFRSRHEARMEFLTLAQPQAGGWRG